MLIIDEFDFTGEVGALSEACARFICAKRGKDPNATNNTGNQEWISFLHEAETLIGVISLCQKARYFDVHQRIVHHNGHIEDAIEVMTEHELR